MPRQCVRSDRRWAEVRVWGGRKWGTPAVVAATMGGMKMHADQLHVDVETVRRLVEVQFPQWRGLPVTELHTAGTVNTIFRMGDDLAARFPMVGQDPALTRSVLAAEAEASRELAQTVRMPTPEPVAIGDPGAGYPL